MKNHTQNVMEKLFPDPFLKSQNRAYLGINTLKSYHGTIIRIIKVTAWKVSKYGVFSGKSRKRKSSISGYISHSEFYGLMQFALIVFQVEDYRYILKVSCGPLALTSYKDFVKNKKRSGTSLPASFSTWFLEKNIALIIFY